MAVNLNGIDLAGGTPLGLTRKHSPSAAPAADAQESAPQSNEVKITSTAEVLAQVRHALTTQPAIDQGRVDAVSRAIAAGSYRVDPERIASGLMQSERDLGRLALK
jgi:negative regulator of flagellin synthesis FlgM